MTGLFKHWKTRRYATEDRAKNVEDFNGAQGKIALQDTLDKKKPWSIHSPPRNTVEVPYGSVFQGVFKSQN